MIKSDMIKLALIGIGLHSKSIYMPLLEEIQKDILLKIMLAIDIHEKIQEIRQWFKSQKIKPEKLESLEFFAHSMSKKTEKYLDKLVLKEKIDTITISTPPYRHKAYALWAIKHGFHILINKLISTYFNVVNDEEKAKTIYDDYFEILTAYKELQKTEKTAFMVYVKRRYHLGFFKVLDSLKDISCRFNLLITSMHVYNSDGKWRMPREIVTHSVLNIGMTGGDKPVVVESAEDLNKENNLDITLFQHSKKSITMEFLNLIKNPHRLGNSHIESHEVSIKIMSAIYLSHIKQKQGESPIISLNI